MDGEEKALEKGEEMRVKGCHLSSCLSQSVLDYFPLSRCICEKQAMETS